MIPDVAGRVGHARLPTDEPPDLVMSHEGPPDGDAVPRHADAATITTPAAATIAPASASSALASSALASTAPAATAPAADPAAAPRVVPPSAKSASASPAQPPATTPLPSPSSPVRNRELQDLAVQVEREPESGVAARLDLEDARETAEPAAFDRLDQALTQSAQLLRTTVSELHPAVLEQSGLAAAVSGLARTAADRGGLELAMDVADWPASARTRADLLLFGTARELLANVVRHADADRLRVELSLLSGRAELVVTDDGVGADPAT